MNLTIPECQAQLATLRAEDIFGSVPARLMATGAQTRQFARSGIRTETQTQGFIPMNNTSFAYTVLKTLNLKGEPVTFQAGDVIRREDGNGSAWSDCLILGFSRPQGVCGSFVKLARPYAYASCIGTTGPGIVTGAEEFIIEATKLRFERVVSSSPMVMSRSAAPKDQGYDSEIIDLTK